MGRHSGRRELSLSARARAAAVVASLCAAAAIGLCAAWTQASGPAAGAGAPSLEAGQVAQELAGDLSDFAEERDAAESVLGSVEPERRQSAAPVREEAAAVLEGYGREGDCALVQGTYLGLLGDTWGCVVYGGDWAEICVVSALGDGPEGGGSEVRTWRLTEEELAESLR